MHERRRKILLSIALVGVLAMGMILLVWRIYKVNEPFSGRTETVFALGEPASYGGESSSGDSLQYGDVTLTAKASPSLLDLSALIELEPAYRNRTLEGGSANDMRALLVPLTLTNQTQTPKTVRVPDFHAESGAWSNGLNRDLYCALNGDAGLAVELKPNETMRLTLAYCAYDSQFNTRSAWEGFASGNFSLVLALYPDKTVMDLGVPAAAFQRQLQEEA